MVVTAVDDVVAIVVGAACFPPPLEHDAKRRAKAATTAQPETRFGDIVMSMTLALLGRFPEVAFTSACGSVGHPREMHEIEVVGRVIGANRAP